MQVVGGQREREDPLEIWGGVEYTCNRVHDTYFDQMELSGHASRLDDYQAIAELGITTLRTGLLWERHEREPSWQWSDQRMDVLRSLGIRPIAGLVHHGSGPQHTNLLADDFAPKLARYAGEVAERYPWIDSYTPVNEPHTTARFSARYGVWYPHASSHECYVRALLNQVKATVLSMQSIRRVRSDARLIQTDDVGNICGTPELRSTWEQLNLRQWLVFDLLCGTVERSHPLFAYLLRAGITEAEILWFAENPCKPDVIGINYYPTSDRYLDHQVDLYPENRQSAEGAFVDVEAVRVPAGIVGVDALIEAAWSRYRIPCAITEVHLGSNVEEQVRWLIESWNGAKRARDRGAQCCAVTLWALLGSYFWNELVTRDNGHYEAGVFDVSSGVPVSTELVTVVRQLTSGEHPQHAALARRGWWRQRERVLFPVREAVAA